MTALTSATYAGRGSLNQKSRTLKDRLNETDLSIISQDDLRWVGRLVLGPNMGGSDRLFCYKDGFYHLCGEGGDLVSPCILDRKSFQETGRVKCMIGNMDTQLPPLFDVSGLCKFQDSDLIRVFEEDNMAFESRTSNSGSVATAETTTKVTVSETMDRDRNGGSGRDAVISVADIIDLDPSKSNSSASHASLARSSGSAYRGSHSKHKNSSNCRRKSFGGSGKGRTGRSGARKGRLEVSRPPKLPQSSSTPPSTYSAPITTVGKRHSSATNPNSKSIKSRGGGGGRGSAKRAVASSEGGIGRHKVNVDWVTGTSVPEDGSHGYGTGPVSRSGMDLEADEVYHNTTGYYGVDGEGYGDIDVENLVDEKEYEEAGAEFCDYDDGDVGGGIGGGDGGGGDDGGGVCEDGIEAGAGGDHEDLESWDPFFSSYGCRRSLFCKGESRTLSRIGGNTPKSLVASYFRPDNMKESHQLAMLERLGSKKASETEPTSERRSPGGSNYDERSGNETKVSVSDWTVPIASSSTSHFSMSENEIALVKSFFRSTSLQILGELEALASGNVFLGDKPKMLARARTVAKKLLYSRERKENAMNAVSIKSGKCAWEIFSFHQSEALKMRESAKEAEGGTGGDGGDSDGSGSDEPNIGPDRRPSEPLVLNITSGLSVAKRWLSSREGSSWDPDGEGGYLYSDLDLDPDPDFKAPEISERGRQYWGFKICRPEDLHDRVDTMDEDIRNFGHIKTLKEDENFLSFFSLFCWLQWQVVCASPFGMRCSKIRESSLMSGGGGGGGGGVGRENMGNPAAVISSAVSVAGNPKLCLEGLNFEACCISVLYYMVTGKNVAVPRRNKVVTIVPKMELAFRLVPPITDLYRYGIPKSAFTKGNGQILAAYNSALDAKIFPEMYGFDFAKSVRTDVNRQRYSALSQ